MKFIYAILFSILLVQPALSNHSTIKLTLAVGKQGPTVDAYIYRQSLKKFPAVLARDLTLKFFGYKIVLKKYDTINLHYKHSYITSTASIQAGSYIIDDLGHKVPLEIGSEVVFGDSGELNRLTLAEEFVVSDQYRYMICKSNVSTSNFRRSSRACNGEGSYFFLQGNKITIDKDLDIFFYPSGQPSSVRSRKNYNDYSWTLEMSTGDLLDFSAQGIVLDEYGHVTSGFLSEKKIVSHHGHEIKFNSARVHQGKIEYFTDIRYLGSGLPAPNRALDENNGVITLKSVTYKGAPIVFSNDSSASVDQQNQKHLCQLLLPDQKENNHLRLYTGNWQKLIPGPGAREIRKTVVAKIKGRRFFDLNTLKFVHRHHYRSYQHVWLVNKMSCPFIYVD